MSLANKEEADRALSIAKTHHSAGKLSSALKFAQKSVSLFETKDGKIFVELIERDIVAAASGPSSSSSTSNGNAKAGPSSARTTSSEPDISASGLHQRPGHGSATGSGSGASDEKKKASHTPEQMRVVKRVKACKVAEYYAILERELRVASGSSALPAY